VICERIHFLLHNERATQWLACLAIVLVTAFAYHNSFSGPFIFDDLNAIPNNSTIRNLWPIWPVITPMEGGGTVCGRPILNLSFALNYALGGLNVWGYHLGNLLIHISAALAFFGFLRRTFLWEVLKGRFGRDSVALALAITLLWSLHPIQTASVTYIVQRAESLAGLFYLLSLYLFVRGLEPNANRAWLWAAVGTCAVGMGCKETVVSLPVMALIYDRTFVAGTFQEGWRQRGRFYLAMFSTWILLAYFIVATNSRGGSAGLADELSTIKYLQTQCCAIVEYLRLSFWPSPLIFDYGTPVILKPSEYLLPGVLVAIALITSLIAAWRKSVFGFFGVWFFAVLAPSSSFVAVVTQTMACHRMYLPLVSVMALAVFAVYSRLGRIVFLFSAVAAGIFCWMTIQRYLDYRSEALIWSDTVKKCPTNPRALGNLGGIILRANGYAEARLLLEESVRINPRDANTRSNLGIALFQTGSKEQAIKEFRMVLELNPGKENGHLNLGMALVDLGKINEAEVHLQEALKQNPGDGMTLDALDAIRLKREALGRPQR